jgi:hypothetical protein
MPSFTFFTSQQGASVLADMSTDNSASTFVAQGAVVASTTFSSVISGIGNGQAVTIAGQVWSNSANTIFLGGHQSVVSVTSSGSVLNSAGNSNPAIVLGFGTGTNSLNRRGGRRRRRLCGQQRQYL